MYVCVGEMIWSKLDSGRLPNLQEITLHIEKKQEFIPEKEEDFSFPDDSFPDDHPETT